MAVKSVRLRNENLEVLVPPTEKTYAITTVTVCNNSSTESSSFDMHVVASGDPISAGQHDPNATKVINNLTLAPEETFTFDTEKVVLGEGDKVVFFSQPGIMDDPSGVPGNMMLTNLGVMISYLEV
jgi:hypothetical protein